MALSRLHRCDMDMKEVGYKLLAGDMVGPSLRFYDNGCQASVIPGRQIPSPTPYARDIKCDIPSARISAIELGGDPDKPWIRPNLNIIAGPAVDHVCDVSDGIPIESQSVGLVFSSFVLEHIRHCKLPAFLRDVYRVLVRRGVTLMVTANLQGQCKLLVESDHWEDDFPYLIFGGNPDVAGNYHMTGFSPEYAVRVFRRAGFERVGVWDYPPFPGLEMIIEAWK